MYGKMDVSNPLVAVQDSMARSCFRLCAELLSARASSMMFYTSGFPGMLAPLLSRNSDEVTAQFARVQSRIVAWEKALECKIPSIEAIARKSFLSSRYMRAVASSRVSGLAEWVSVVGSRAGRAGRRGARHCGAGRCRWGKGAVRFRGGAVRGG